MGKTNESDLLTRAEVMKLLKVSGVTLSKFTTAGKLTFYRVGRRLLFDKSEILAEIKNQKLV